MVLKSYLNQLWAGVIEEFEISPLNHTITLTIKSTEYGIEKKFNIVFGEVSAYFFVENNGDKRFNLLSYDEEDYLELTSIEYYEDGVGKVMIESSTSRWTDQYFSSANFVLEIWSSVLFIEANTVGINGEIFKVEYPRN